MVGTIRINKKGIPKKGVIPKSGKGKKARGFMHSFTTKIRGNNYYFTGWVDSKPCHFLSTFPPEYSSVPRNSKNKKGKFERLVLQRPTIVKAYNEGMGGTDLFDQYGSYYNTSLRCDKWHLRIFTHFLQAACINSYILYISKYKINMSYLEFLDSLIDQLASSEPYLEDSDSENSSIAELPPEKKKMQHRKTWEKDPSRLQPGDHIPIQHKQMVHDTRRWCMMCQLHKPGQFCLLCGVSLCTDPNYNCFQMFHQLEKFPPPIRKKRPKRKGI